MLGLGRSRRAPGRFRFAPSPLLTPDTRAIGANAVLSLIEAAESLGFPRERALSGLGEEARRQPQPRGPASWRDLVLVIANLERAGMGIAELERAGDLIGRSRHLLLRPIAEFFLRPEHLLYVGLRWVGPATFPVLHTDLEYRGRDMRLTLELPESLPGCAAFFHVTRGAVAAAPTSIGQPPAHVSASVSPRRACYDIHCAPFERGAVRLGRIARTLFSVPRVVETLAEQERSMRRSFEAALESQSQFLRILGALPDGVAIVRDEIVVYANPALASMLAEERASELSGASFSALFAASGTQAPAGTGRHLSRSDGRSIALELSPRQRIEYEGRAAELVVVRDVTERNRLVSQLALADRMASLSTLAAGIAHEINNPLTLVMGNLELAARAPARSADLLRAASDGAARVRDIVRELGKFARPQRDAMAAVDLREVVESTVALFRGRLSGRAQLELELEPVPAVFGSRNKLGQVLLNLLMNALEALPPERKPNESRIVVRLHASERGAVLEVQDDGCGIPAHVEAHVFTPFFTARHGGGGSGLGLAVAHDIVAQSDGIIDFTSSPGRGTTFRVELPAAGCDVVTSEPPASSIPPGRSARILVADDEPGLRRTLEIALGHGHHHVVSAASGREAIAHIDNNGRFDLILCDLMMPDGTGADVYAHVAAHHPELARRMVFMTGGRYRDETGAFLASIDNPLLDKPFQLAELDGVIERVLAGDGPSAGRSP